MTPRRTWVMLVGMLSVIASRRQPLARPREVPAPVRPSVEGLASWYGFKHEGRLMANGKPFHALSLSAASPYLPFGTRVRVVSLANGLSVDLTITDRGPYAIGRIIDVSLGAARRLEMERSGVVRVRVELL